MRAAWAQASTWHVAINGSDITGDGSETKPFATIQHGIDTASDGDTVLVHPGVYNVTIVGNWTAGQGGGLNVSYMSQTTFVNSIIWGNSPEQIYFDTDWPGEAITIEYSDVQGGEAGIVTNGQGPVYWGDGNMDASPRFVNIGLGNYHLVDDSPCINAGKAAGAPTTDIEGNPRPNPAGSNPDMGAYENPSPVSLAPHLESSQQVVPSPVQMGGLLTYALHVTNTGSVDLHAIITDTLPAHVTPTGILTWTGTITTPGGVWAR